MLALLAWSGLLVSAGALTATAITLPRLLRTGVRRDDYLRTHGVRTAFLLGMWLLLLVGSVGLLAGQGWAANAVRGWAVMLLAWSVWYGLANLIVVHGMDEYVPGATRSVVIGGLVSVLAVLAIAACVFLVLARASL